MNNEKLYAGQQIPVSEEGFLTDFNHWTPNVGAEIAIEEGIEMTDAHWNVVNYLQEQHKQDVPLTVRRVGKSGVVDIKGFYQLFPKGPLKAASKIAGIPKPVSCI